MRTFPLGDCGSLAFELKRLCFRKVHMEKLGSRKPVMELDHLLFQSKHEVYLLTVFHFFSLMQKYGVFKQIRCDPVVDRTKQTEDHVPPVLLKVLDERQAKSGEQANCFKVLK